VRELLQAAAGDVYTENRFAEWDPVFLIDYIVNNHHAYVRKMIPVLSVHTQKIASVHGQNHPELIKVAEHFQSVARELSQHMQKEELVLFPYIKSLLTARLTGTAAPASPFGSVRNPIKMMEAEHQNAGDELYAVRSLSSGYTVPADGCTTYHVTYQELQDFERDLHQHVHLENNILFPLAVALEQELVPSN
jgi:regulator of cell morphogenesis and NO signaling